MDWKKPASVIVRKDVNRVATSRLICTSVMLPSEVYRIGGAITMHPRKNRDVIRCGGDFDETKRTCMVPRGSTSAEIKMSRIPGERVRFLAIEYKRIRRG
jgi:hypothetical protein